MKQNKKTVLGDICRVIDCEHKTAPSQTEGIPLIRTPNIGRGILKLDNVQRVSSETYSKWTRRAEPQQDDLIMAREAPVGNVAIIPKGVKVCLGQRTVLIRIVNDAINPRYLNYLLSSNAMHAYLNILSNGATVGHLNVGDIRKLNLPQLPPLNIQKKIAAILSAYDDLIENNKRRIALLENIAEEIYREWFVRFRFPGYQQAKFEKGIPANWEEKKFGEFCTLKRGYDLPNSRVEEGKYPVIASTSVKAYHNAFKVEPPVITTGRSGSLGTVLFINKQSWPLNTTLYVKNMKGNSPYYIYYTLKHMGLENFNSGAGVPTLNRNHLNCIKIRVPSDDIQKEFQAKLTPIFRLIEIFNTSSAHLNDVKNLLLGRLISGKLSVENLDIQFPPSML